VSGFDSVKALVFDVFGTVVDWREGIARDAAPVLAQLGRRDIDPRAFADAWRKRYQPAMEECRSGRRAWTRLDVLHREHLDGVLQDHGIDPAQLGEAALDDLNRAWHRLDPWPEAVAGLTRLKRKFIIAPLSNGNIALMTNMAKRAGIPWDAILGAEVVQAYKPQPEAYTRTAEVLGIRRDELCLVAAHNGDLKAAKSVGLRTAFVPRPLEYGPKGKPDSTPDASVDITVKDFVELAERLGPGA